MNSVSAFTFADAFGQLAQAQLGHADRTSRLVETACQISRHPQGTLPQKIHHPAAYRATLRLMNQKQVTHQSILQPHYQATRQQVSRHSSPLLAIHDTTDLDYSHQKTLSSLGPIGNGGGRGYLCHNSLAVDLETGEMLGLLNQILHIRQPVPQGERVATKRERQNRESRLWYQALDQIAETPTGGEWIHVCDRGADTFETLEYLLQREQSFVIRSCHNRSLVLEGNLKVRLHDYLRTQAALIGWEVAISANRNQPARLARVQACWQPVCVRAPHVRRGEHSREPLSLWAIRVWEVDVTEGVQEPLEWFLLTEADLTDPSVARQRVRCYERRVRIEDYHKVKKTGLCVEQLQLQSLAGLEPMIALLSILAVGLANSREAARDPVRAEQSAEDYFDPLWVWVLCLWRYQTVRPLSVREYILALGRLGGHQNRKCDGLPGWQTLWRGQTLLQSMVEFEMARQTALKFYGKH